MSKYLQSKHSDSVIKQISKYAIVHHHKQKPGEVLGFAQPMYVNSFQFHLGKL